MHEQLTLFDGIDIGEDVGHRSPDAIRHGGKTETYEEFLSKFTDIPHTTDECHTPQPVYEAVRDWFVRHYHLEGRVVVRPFYPNGDYTNLEQYPSNCVVIDNPPFSIYSQIIHYYNAHGISFVLFGPALTLIHPGLDVCYHIANTGKITYANNAVVNTGFVTNLDKQNRIILNGELEDLLRSVSNAKKRRKMYSYDYHITTAALIKKSVVPGKLIAISQADAQPVSIQIQTVPFGCAVLLSSKAADMCQQANLQRCGMSGSGFADDDNPNIPLSARAQAIVKKMDENNQQNPNHDNNRQNEKHL